MKKNNFSEEDIKKLLNQAGQQMGTDPDKLQNELEPDKLQAILSKLKPSESAKIQQVLQDPERTKEMLNSPQAKLLMKKLTGGK